MGQVETSWVVDANETLKFSVVKNSGLTAATAE